MDLASQDIFDLYLNLFKVSMRKLRAPQQTHGRGTYTSLQDTYIKL